ncbi:DNA polymerase I [Micractinium conductrix]|uniref:DNA polymerase I n=1 Tax=Micractinium conductrix TaxID=554055 RepID=A0A2P6V7I8_9CHLO|nr:DNA polymerase I [Micractinium conductrix]|eukprot:PSC70053.1 DNA polymerase I [Micractinium conductrix]
MHIGRVVGAAVGDAPVAAGAVPPLVGPPHPASAAAAECAALQSNKRMILCDAMALLYRSHYAFSEAHRLRNVAGEDTTVLFGFLSTLFNLLEVQPPPTHFAVVFDARGKTFRHEIYEGYKGQRASCPEEIKEAIPRLQQLLRAMAIPFIQVSGVEADDVIGTLAVRAVEEDIVVAIASPDKDFFQLLRAGVMLLRPPKKPAPGERVNKFAMLPYYPANFKEDYGLEPRQFIDLLALAGDSSDNVPGVQGIGPKTAAALLRQYGTLEGVLDHAAEAKPKKAAAQLSSPEGRAAAQLSQKLVRIETALDHPPVQLPLEQLRLQLPADRGADLLKQFQRLDFTRHTARVKDLWAGPLYQAR